MKNKTLKMRFGDPALLLSVDAAKARIDAQLAKRMRGFVNDIKQNYHTHLMPLLAQKTGMEERHKVERQTLTDKQKERWQQESKERQARLNKGLQGLWDRLTGKYSHTTNQNETEAYQAFVRDKEQRENLIQRQLLERRTLQRDIKYLRGRQEEEIQHLKEMLFSNLSPDRKIQLQHEFEKLLHRQNGQSPQNGNDYDLSM